MSRQFTVTIRNDDLSAVDIYLAIENYVAELIEDGEISGTLEFEIVAMD